jgi:hypothetical protein
MIAHIIINTILLQMERQKLLWLLFFVVINNNSTQAGIHPPPTSAARAASMGNAYTAIQQNFWSLFQNPAGIAGMERTSVGLYAERRFGLSELNCGHAGIVFPFDKNQAVGATIASLGFEAYRESYASLTYAINFKDRINLGTRVSYGNLFIDGLGSTSSFGIDVGLQTRINDEVSIGFQANNVNRSSLNYLDGQEDNPTIISSGIAYQPNNKLVLVADIQKDIDHPLSFRGGLEYQFIDGFYARMGVGTQPMSLSGGLGFQRDNLLIDVAFSFREPLGYTPHISIQYLI